MLRKLFINSRFWILAIGVIASINIAGALQLTIASGSLQAIRIGQTYGFISLTLLYVAILASPLYKVFPNLALKARYFHARRALGVLAYYFAMLHVLISFFGQLGGFHGIGYFDARYNLSLLVGLLALGILFIMAATSLDVVISKMGYKQWKLLHRLVYIASFAVLIHVILIGPHYSRHLSLLGLITYLAAVFLVSLEAIRFSRWQKARP